MKKYSLLLICLLFSVIAMSQKAVISFDSKTHDFGKVNEEDGKITYIFDFVNKGSGSLVINRVQASCGCTTPTWSKEPIEPGKKGSITVTYNPTGRPGAFTKAITVYSNGVEEQFVLTIHGEVIPKQTGENSAYPIKMGSLSLKTKVLQMNTIEKGKSQTRTLEILNASKNNITPSLYNLPPYITVAISPITLKPKDEGKITFTFNSSVCKQWGPVSDEAYLTLDGTRKISDEYKILLVGNVVEDFSKLTLDQKRKSPILEIAQKVFNFGLLKANQRKTIKLKVLNKGQNPLEIRRVINNNNEFSVKFLKSTIPGNKSTEVIADLNTKNLVVGDYKKTFTIQTNDPENSFLILIVSWSIK